MQPTITTPPVSPPTGKKSSAPMIIAVIAAVILSLCCCCSGGTILSGSLGAILGEDAGGALDPMFGLVCIGAAIIPLFIPVIVFLVRKSRK